MNRYFESLMDVLIPPPNLWLRNLSNRRGCLPVGVTIVRFTEGDDQFDDAETAVTWRVMRKRHDRSPQTVPPGRDPSS